jgi:UPF0755 protein
MRFTATQALGGIGGVFTLAVVVIAALLLAESPDRAIHDGIIAPPAVSENRGNVPYTLPEGASASDIGAALEQLGVIRSSRQFQVLVSLMGLQSRLSAGDYALQRGSATLSVISRLTVQDQAPTIRVTFPEGIRIEEMAVIAQKAGFGSAEEFMAAASQPARLPAELAAGIPEGQDLQGYLFPDTYIMPVGTPASELVQLMVDTFLKRFSPSLRETVRTDGRTVHDVVTLASIVEREAVLEPERPLIAGVFYNRLKEGDRLGADPTTQYAITIGNPGEVARFGWWKKELTIEDLANTSPYNTRLNTGLPPGPITNPGLASLEAAAKPATTKFYYFVADAIKGDGSHVFAETLAEHERNQARVNR